MAKLTIAVPAETFEKSMDKAYRQMAGRVTVHGFRKGKAPRQIVERVYGREILLEDAINDAIPQAFSQAVEELGRQYECIVYPKYDVVSSEKGEGLTFTATYDLKPVITLGQYKGMEVGRLSEEIEDGAVETQLAAMRERFARLDPSEDPAAMGDVCKIDFKGRIGDEPFEGGEGKDYSLELGSGTFIPGFEEQIVGAVAGDDLEVEVTFPEDYHAESLAGKDAIFEVTVHDVQHKTLAEMDDEFAKDVSEFETLEELRKSLEEKIIKDAQDKVQADFQSRAVEKAVAGATCEVPESMIEFRKDQLVDNFANQITRQGIALDMYLQYAQISIEELRDSFKDQAERELTTELVVEAIAEAEGLLTLDEELNDEYARLAEQTGSSVEVIVSMYEKNKTMLDSLKFSLMMSKTIKMLADSAKAVPIVQEVLEESEVIEPDAGSEQEEETPEVETPEVAETPDEEAQESVDDVD